MDSTGFHISAIGATLSSRLRGDAGTAEGWLALSIRNILADGSLRFTRSIKGYLLSGKGHISVRTKALSALTCERHKICLQKLIRNLIFTKERAFQLFKKAAKCFVMPYKINKSLCYALQNKQRPEFMCKLYVINRIRFRCCHLIISDTITDYQYQRQQSYATVPQY